MILLYNIINMIIPVRCFTCNNILSNKYEIYKSKIDNSNDDNILTNLLIKEIKEVNKVNYIDVLIAKYIFEEVLHKKEEKRQFLINEVNFKINSINEELIDVNDVEKLIKIDDYNITYYQEVLTKLNDNILDLDLDYYNNKLKEYKQIKSSTGILLDELGLNRYCCRRCFISCVELVNII